MQVHVQLAVALFSADNFSAYRSALSHCRGLSSEVLLVAITLAAWTGVVCMGV